MRIGILTHPFQGNYGGMLQAYALFQVLRRKGHDAVILDFHHRRLPSFRKSPIAHLRARLNLKKRIKLLLIWLNLKNSWLHIPGDFSHKNGQRFHRKYVQGIKLGANPATQLEKHGIEAIVVGSDQVWRALYVRYMGSLPFFFLNFATQAQRQQSIAYAASFGSDEWEGTPEETEECAGLLRDFKAVSVREHSGIEICREVFGVEAVQMPDPTLLLEQEDYNHLIRNRRTKSTDTPFMAVYLLDETEEKKTLIHTLSKETGLHAQHLMSHPGAKRLMDRLPLSVPQWLRFVRDSECVLTDSFHGCVFSIIFNKPFICLGNENRGSARFDSLLDTFDLKERLVTNPSTEQLQQLIRTPINWEKVNHIRNAEKERAIAFLKDNLESR